MITRRKKRNHAAFFICPAFADTVPTLSVVATLVRRGFRVSYVTTERFSSMISELGAEFVRSPSLQLGSAPDIEDSPEESRLFALTTATLSAVTEFYKSNKVDVIVHDSVSFAGRILAKQLGIPAVQVSCDFRMNRNRPSRQAAAFFNLVVKWTEGVREFLLKYGITADGHCFSDATSNIYFYPRIFQLDGDESGENCFYAGRCAPERPCNEKWKPKEAEDLPIILVSTSTLFLQGPDYFEMCIEALAGLQCHVVLQMGQDIDERRFGTLPPHFEVRRSKPQMAVLPYVSLLVCAGGMMSTVEAVYSGVPMLTLTNGNIELEAYAENGVRLGIGKHLKKAEASVESIRNSVQQMSDDSDLFSKVEQMKRLVRAEPGAEEVANRLDKCVNS